MAFTPISAVYLLDTPLDNNYKNQLHFNTVAEQWSYFRTCVKHTFESVTYQRKDSVIKVDKYIDDLLNTNYVMYQNGNYSNKWFYAFITKFEYVNPNTTNIYIETDVYQTWFAEATLKPSFVVREHVSDDTIGKHLVDEQLEYGEYKLENYHASNELGENWNILAVSDNSPLGNNELVGNLYGYVVTGLTYFPFPNTSAGVTWLKNTIKIYDDAGKSDAIVMIFTVPWLALRNTVDNPNWHVGLPITSGTSFGLHVFNEDKMLTSIDGYTPKNNKLFTYPYKFLYASNSDGQSATFRYEDFSNPTSMGFTVFGVVMPSPKVMLAPNGYKGDNLKYEHGLVLSGYPLCSWTSDTYTAWLAQNSAGLAVGIGSSIIAGLGGVLTGNGVAMLGGVLGVLNQVGQIGKASVQPDQAKGQAGSGNLMFGIDAFDFYLAHMNIKAEFAKRIDDFLSMFGYKVNALKTPTINSRQNWNYVQTIDVNIDGAIPSEDMNKLKNMYNNGVTFWHSPSGFLNYGLSNNII